MTPWREIHAGSDRIRWRHDGEEHAHYSAGYELEVWHEFRGEWRPVRNWSSRGYFVLGLLAGRRECVLPLVAPEAG